MKKRSRILGVLMAAVLAGTFVSGCAGSGDADEKADTKEEKQETKTDGKEPVTILAAAAASLEYSYTDELIPMFEKKYPYITVKGTYDSSAKLQTQIDEGLEADVFMSAAAKQMNALA